MTFFPKTVIISLSQLSGNHLNAINSNCGVDTPKKVYKKLITEVTFQPLKWLNTYALFNLCACIVVSFIMLIVPLIISSIYFFLKKSPLITYIKIC